MALRTDSATDLAATVRASDADDRWLSWRTGVPDGEPGWTTCADVDSGFLAEWEQFAAAGHVRHYGRSDPRAATAYVLDWYAALPGTVGGGLFRRARRVPRLDPAALAFRRHPTEGHPCAVALLDPRFWCLPGDPAAGTPDATVVADDAALAAVLRAQVRGHADAFLSWYRPSARLPRRDLLGAFFDGLDTGIWSGADPDRGGALRRLADAALALPGRTEEFRDASTLHLLTDAQGREHLTRSRVSCCNAYRLQRDGLACFTCPRTTAADRAQRAAVWEDFLCLDGGGDR